MSSMVAVFFILLLVGAWVAGRWSASATPPAPTGTADPRSTRELAERDAFIEQLRELAWQHRDVSPELSTIIIDEITTHHRRLSSGPDA